jgi:putative ABC transport system permease protein
VFIAVRDLLHAKGRFLLMEFVIALVAYLMTFLSGFSTGLIGNNMSGLVALPVSHFVFMADDRPTSRSSLVDRVVSIVDGQLSETPGAGHAAH